MTELGAEGGDFRRLVVRELQALEEDILWTEKAHFSAAELQGWVNVTVGLGATILAAVAAAAVVAEVGPWLPGVAALLAAVGSGVLTFLKPKDASGAHLYTGRRLGALRVKVRQAVHLDCDPAIALAPAELRSIVEDLAAEKSSIDKDAPGTSGVAFKGARRKIDAGHFEHAVADTPKP